MRTILGIAYERLKQMHQAREYRQEALAIYEETQSPHAQRVLRWLESLERKEDYGQGQPPPAM